MREAKARAEREVVLKSIHLVKPRRRRVVEESPSSSAGCSSRVGVDRIVGPMIAWFLAGLNPGEQSCPSSLGASASMKPGFPPMMA
jgi:hypothetical protein